MESVFDDYNVHLT